MNISNGSGYILKHQDLLLPAFRRLSPRLYLEFLAKLEKTSG